MSADEAGIYFLILLLDSNILSKRFHCHDFRKLLNWSIRNIRALSETQKHRYKAYTKC